VPVLGGRAHDVVAPSADPDGGQGSAARASVGPHEYGGEVGQPYGVRDLPRRCGPQRLVDGLVLFVAAGTIMWANGWAFLGVSLLVVLANAVYVLPRNPEIIVERGRRHKGSRPFDTIVMSVYALFHLALFAVAGLDAGRLHWAPLGVGWAVLGALLMVVVVVATVPFTAMAVDRNLERRFGSRASVATTW
jgi:hypothetical protein